MKLNQIISIEKGVKSRVYSETTEQDRLCQKAELFNGFSKKYRPLDEENGEKLPPESKRVQFRVDEILKSQARSLSELFDVTATKDWANMKAVADVKIGDQVLLRSVPVTYLLFLEKQLNDLHTAVGRLPELDQNNEWSVDKESGLYKTEMTQTHRVKPTKRGIVLYDATDKHPAQTQLIEDSVLVGYWEKVDHSGAISKIRKAEMLEKIEALMKAVKFAREEANSIEAEKQTVGEVIFEFIGF